MNDDRWGQVKTVLAEVLASAAAERTAVLDRLCGSDRELRQSVESLLEVQARADAVTKSVSPGAALQRDTSTLPQIAHYRVTAKIGEGGSGEVYRATDTKLGREVAIKMLPEIFARDPERMARFEREAKVLASLNHPNIAAIHSVEDRALILELVEGPTLKERAARGPLPLDDALLIARQMAEALEYAHERGVIHRDLKPANVKITQEGQVKLLDFGLAKAIEGPTEDSGDRGDSPTLTMGATRTGIILGTAAYMSPEQANGRKADRRADIWSFGAVLYELLSGEPAFRGETTTEKLAAVLKLEPDWSALPKQTPAAVVNLLRRCLTKDRKQRLQAIGEARIALENPGKPEVASAADISVVKSRPIGPALALAGSTLVAGTVLFLWLAPPPQIDLSSYKFTPIARTEADEVVPAWSPDGKSIAYSATVHGIYQVFAKIVGAAEPAQLTHSDQNCVMRFWSPDGAIIYYQTADGLWAVPSSGGTPERLTEKDMDFLASHPDGATILFLQPDGRLWIGSLKDGPLREFWWQAPQHSLISARFSADGSKLAIADGADLWIVDYPNGGARRIFSASESGAMEASWFPDSRHLVVTDNSGSILSRMYVIDTKNGGRRTIYAEAKNFSTAEVSPDGKRIAYDANTLQEDVLEISLPGGKVKTMLEGNVSAWPDWAPSGTHYLVSTDRSGDRMNIDDISLDGFSRRVADAPPDTSALLPKWAPDGTRFAFVVAGKGCALKVSNAPGGREIAIAELGNLDNRCWGFSWSPDGQWIVGGTVVSGKPRLMKIKPVAGSTPVIIDDAEPDSYAPQWSPGGDWILYSSATGMSLVSPDGTKTRKLSPRRLPAYGFSKDGREVFGIDSKLSSGVRQWQLYAIDVGSGTEKMLAPLDLPSTISSFWGFSLHPDGKRFLTSTGKAQWDIWMLEGFDQPKSWLDRLLRR